MTSPKARAELERLIADGLQRYRRGEVDGALAAWETALKVVPGDARATGYVDYVRQHYDELVPEAPSPIAELLVPFELGATDEEEDGGDYEVMISRGDPPPMKPAPTAEHLAQTWRGERMSARPSPEDGWPIEGSGVGKDPAAAAAPADDAYESITLGSAGRSSSEIPIEQLRAAAEDSGETTLGGYHQQRRATPSRPTVDLGRGDFANREPTGEPTRERSAPPERRRTTAPLGMAPLIAPAARTTSPQTPQTLRGGSTSRPPAPARPTPASSSPPMSRAPTPEPSRVPTPEPSRTTTSPSRTTAPIRPPMRTHPPPPAPPPPPPPLDDLDLDLGLGLSLDLDLPGSPLELGIETIVPGSEPLAAPPAAPQDDRAVHVEELRLPPPSTARVHTIDNNDELAPPLPPLSSLGGPNVQLLAEVDRDRPARETPEEVARRRIPRLIERARVAAAGGESELVVAAIELALSQAPDSAVAQKLIHKQRDVLLDCYYRYFGSLEKRPVVTGNLSDLKGGGGRPPIDPRAAFLLSRIDGMLTYDELLDVSGMGRLEACRHLAHLIGRGLVRST